MTVKVGFVTHAEAMIKNFMNEPDYADYYLQTVLTDGDADEIREAQGWYDAAKTRAANLGYWSSLVDNAERTAKSGQNLDVVIGLMTRAMDILKAAVPVSA